MLARSMIAASLIAAPALALAAPGEAPVEAKIRNMSEYIEAVVDPQQGIYIQGYTGQWYYARVRGNCQRLNRSARLSFIPSPGGDFDRLSSIRADGFHCFIDSVTESAGPPRRGDS
ncbi:MAG TPA: hypothetical protein VLK25_07765 [Allosphingosinicella sp.]|nr:hypothetical protein [Allosphingosinicella sp.]